MEVLAVGILVLILLYDRDGPLIGMGFALGGAGSGFEGVEGRRGSLVWTTVMAMPGNSVSMDTKGNSLTISRITVISALRLSTHTSQTSVEGSTRAVAHPAGKGARLRRASEEPAGKNHEVEEKAAMESGFVGPGDGLGGRPTGKKVRRTGGWWSSYGRSTGQTKEREGEGDRD